MFHSFQSRSVMVHRVKFTTNRSASLARSLAPAAARLVFVNTGFLDRTADEIHTSMHAGPMLPKAQLKMAPWYRAYEAGNVAVSIAGDLAGKGQVCGRSDSKRAPVCSHINRMCYG